MTRFAEKLAAGELAVALEITPPKKRLEGVLLRRARLLGGRADAVNVIQRPDRLSSLDASLLLCEAGLAPVWHLVNRGRTHAEIAAELASAAAGAVRAVLCIRGDHRAKDAPDAPRIREVVAMAREALPGALIGATANQYGPRERVLANLWPKLRAGARFVQTNPVFSLDALRPLAEEVRARAPRTRIVPMVMPLVSVATAERIQARLGILPGALLERLAAGGERAGWGMFAEVVQALAESPLVDGLAVMTPEMDAPASHGARIVAALGRAGAWPSP